MIMIKYVDSGGQAHLVTNIRKPRKWRRYEYLQNTSTTAVTFDTGLRGHMNYTYEVKFQSTNGTAYLVFVAGADEGYSKKVMSITYGATSGGRFWMSYWSKDTTSSSIIFQTQDQNIHTARVENGYWEWDGINKGRAVRHSDTFITESNMRFILQASKFFYFKVWDAAGNLIQYFVPSQFNNQYGFWEIINDRFFTSTNSNLLSAGPEIKNYDEIYEVRRSNSILPAGVELYDYIQSTGTQWIDTGLGGTQKNFHEIKYTNEGTGFCFRNATTQLGVKDNRYGTSSNGTYIISASFNSSNSRWVYTNNSNNITFTNMTAPNTESDYLFALNHGNGSTNNYCTNFKVYYYKASNNGVLVRNMLPCTYLGEPGMWDTVENKFYRNQGTGQFTLGNKITLKEYEYLQSDATAYIDTNVYLSKSVDYFLNVELSEVPVNAGYQGINWLCQLQTRADTSKVIYTYDINNKLNSAGTFIETSTRNGQNFPTAYRNWTSLSANNGNIYLFKFNYGSNPYQVANRKIYYCKIKLNNQLIRDFIPVSYNGTPGLWDKVEWKFYANAGSGSFTLGPERASGVYPVWTRIEYLESTGTQYINTGVKADQYSFKLNIQFMNHTSSGEKDVWGNINSSQGDKYGFVSGVSGQNFFQWGGSNWSKTGATANQWHVVTYEYPDANNRNMIADGTSYTVAISNNNIILSNSNIYLFSDGPRGRMKFNGKIKYAKIYINNTLVRDFIPVRIGTTGYMFDKVTGKMFGNSGTGNFVLGPDINI